MATLASAGPPETRSILSEPCRLASSSGHVRVGPMEFPRSFEEFSLVPKPPASSSDDTDDSEERKKADEPDQYADENCNFALPPHGRSLVIRPGSRASSFKRWSRVQ
jgi:hypothetical protein